MEDQFKKFKRAYVTVLEMVRDRGYKLSAEDAQCMAERLTLARFQALSSSAFDMILRHKKDDHTLLIFFLMEDTAPGKRCITT